MGIAKHAESPFRVAPDGSPLSPTALTSMGIALRALDEASRLGGVVFCGMYGQHPEFSALQNQIIWRGGGVFRAGMTTLRIVTETSGPLMVGDTLRVYRGDTDASGNPPATFTDYGIALGTQTLTLALSGYSDGDVIRVMLEVRHPQKPGDKYLEGAKVIVRIAELLPVSTADAAPTLPTFSTVSDLTSTKLNDLANYIDWLIRRIGTRYDPLFISQLRRNGPFRNEVGETDTNVVWRGGLRRSTLHAALTVRGMTYRRYTGATETITLRINGSTVQTYNVPTSLGESAFTLSHTLGGANEDVQTVDLQFNRAAPNLQAAPTNLWTINEIYVDAPGGGASSLGSWAVRQAGVTGASLLAWAQAARQLAADVKSRIDANATFWGVQRLYTMRPAFDYFQLGVFEEWSVPVAWRRTGDLLIGRGRALRLGYGAGWYDEAAHAKQAQTTEGVGAWPLINARTETLVDGDNVETFAYALDSAPGLPPGAPYNVRGTDSWVVTEKLKDV